MMRRLGLTHAAMPIMFLFSLILIVFTGDNRMVYYPLVVSWLLLILFHGHYDRVLRSEGWVV